MHPERWLEDVGASMKIGHVADQTVLVLAKVQARGLDSLKDSDHEILKEAIRFLQSARDGYAWIEQPTISSSSRSFVSSFAAAVRSITPRTTNEAFIAFIEQMSQTLQGILSGTHTPDSEQFIAPARAFFARLTSGITDSVYSAINQNTSPGLSSWNPAVAYFT